MVPRGYGAPGFQGSLSNEQIDKLNKQQQAFFEENRTVREKLYQKQLELRSELAKKDPDAPKTAALQTEISNFQSQLAQKRIEQQIKMKKDFPELADRGYRSGTPGYSRRGMAPGYGSQGMMAPGYGPRGMSPGYGPQGMMAPGYGPRGMSPGHGPQGMMGSGYGHRDMGSGYGPQGMMGPGYGSRGKGAGYSRGGAGWN